MLLIAIAWGTIHIFLLKILKKQKATSTVSSLASSLQDISTFEEDLQKYGVIYLSMHIGKINEVKHVDIFMQEWYDLWGSGLTANM